jgi:hypothetical protein
MTINEVIGQAIGAGSMCWSTLTGAGEFDSTEATKISADAQERVRELIYELVNELGFEVKP